MCNNFQNRNLNVKIGLKKILITNYAVQFSCYFFLLSNISYFHLAILYFYGLVLYIKILTYVTFKISRRFKTCNQILLIFSLTYNKKLDSILLFHSNEQLLSNQLFQFLMNFLRVLKTDPKIKFSKFTQQNYFSLTIVFIQKHTKNLFQDEN